MEALQASQVRLVLESHTLNGAARDAEVSIAPPVTPRFRGAVTPRQRRALLALMSGPVWREELDRIAGASNGPDLIFQLRKRGLNKKDCLICEMLERTDRDGQTVECGRYSLTAQGRLLVREWMERAGLAIAGDPPHIGGQ